MVWYKSSLEEVIAHDKGKIDLRSVSIEILELPIEHKSKDIKKLVRL